MQTHPTVPGGPEAGPEGASDGAWRETRLAEVPGRLLSAGMGQPLVVLPGRAGLQFGRAHELLSQAFEVVGLDLSGEQSLHEQAAHAGRVIESRSAADVNVLGVQEGAPAAVQVAVAQADRVRALVLASPVGLEDDLGQLARLAVPTLVLLGTRARVSPPSHGRRLSAAIPRCHLILVYDAADDIAADRPEAFADTVGDYLRRLEAFVVQNSSGLVNP